MMKIVYTLLLLAVSFSGFAQTNISGKITDVEGNPISHVTLINVSKHNQVIGNASGEFSILVDVNDDLRIMKAGYYRLDNIIKKEDLENPMQISLVRMETLIPGVEIRRKPTGDIVRDSQYLNDSKKVAVLKSEIDDYVKAPLKEPFPKNSVPKSFQPHDFAEGQVDLVKTIAAAVGLIEKVSSPKITTPNYIETEEFLAKVKREADLGFLNKYYMSEERKAHFLAYAEKLSQLSKRFRKNFKVRKIEYELRVAFTEYAKIYPLTD